MVSMETFRGGIRVKTTRKLGNLTVSAVGYGCMSLSNGYGTLPAETESIRLISGVLMSWAVLSLTQRKDMAKGTTFHTT